MLFPYIYEKSVLDGLDDLTESNLAQLCGVRRSWLCLLNTIMAFATFLVAVPKPQESSAIQADGYIQRSSEVASRHYSQPANLEMCESSSCF